MPASPVAPNSEVGRVRAEIENGTLPADAVFLPAEVAGGTREVPGNYSWGYSGAPAAIGVADLGVGTGGFHAYGTSSFEGIAHVESLSTFSPGAGPALEAPDWSSLQLNANLANVTELFGLDQEWVQEVVRLNATQLEFVDNIWGVDGPNVTVGTGNGTNVENLYYDLGPTYPVSFPLNLTLRMSVSSTVAGPVLRFDFFLEEPNGSWNGTFDTVTLDAGVTPGDPVQFVVAGGQTNPLALRDDAEFVRGGDGGGSTAMVEAINGTLQLDRLLASSGNYSSVPSAYDYGTDAGETVEGVSTYYEGTTVYLSPGPSLIYGLWNTSATLLGLPATPGWIDLNLTNSASDAFLFGTNGSAVGFVGAAWVPTDGAGGARFELPPALGGLPYRFGAWANGHGSNTSVSADSNATGTQSIGLTPGGGFDTPIELHSLSQAIAAASGVSGVTLSPSHSDLWVNNSVASLAPPFLQLDEWGYPIFPLFAADGIPGLRIHLLNVTESSSSYLYQMGSLANVSIPGWAQGMFLNRAARGSTVADENEFGPREGATLPLRPATVGVFDTPGVYIDNVSENGTGAGISLFQDDGTVVTRLVVLGPFNSSPNYGDQAVGLNELDSTNTTVTQLVVTGVGAIGINSVGSTGLSVQNWSVVSDWTGPYPCPTGIWGDTGQLAGGSFSGPVAIGVCLLDTTRTDVINGTVEGPGSAGIVGSGATGLNVSYMRVLDGSSAGTVLNSQDIGLFQGSLNNSGNGGWNLSGDSNVSVRDWRAMNGSDVVNWAAHDLNVRLYDLSASNVSTVVQYLEYTSGIVAQNVSVYLLGFAFAAFVFDSNVSMDNISAFVDSYGVAASWTTNGTFRDLTAEDVSMGFLLDGGDRIDVHGVEAVDQSMGLDLNDFGNASIQNATATGASIAVDLATGNNVSIEGVVATGSSTAVYALGIVGGSVADVNATSTPGGPLYYVNPIFGLPFDVGALELWLEINFTVTNVSSLGAGYAVWDLESINLTISDVRSWHETDALQLNYTSGAVASGVFSFDDQTGATLLETTNVTIAASTFEDSRSWGAFVVGGVGTTAYGNNFVGNNGASVNGIYDPATPQAVVANGGFGNFTWDGVGNYWSDWTGGGSYLVGTYVNDTHPIAAFIANWLRFDEIGLLPGLSWTVQFLGVNYTTAYPLFDLPARDLPGNGSLAYTVLPPTGWGATPPRGVVSWGEENETVTLVFSEPGYRVVFNATGLPSSTLWSVSIDGVLWTNRTVAGVGSVRTTLPNGSYPYRISEVANYFEPTLPYSGTLIVYGGDLFRNLQFSRETYRVTFLESGLPSGTPWTVDLNGSLDQVTSDQVAYRVPNGSFAYRVTTVAGWIPTSGSYGGTVNVSGSNRTITVDWRPAHYALSFREVGLARGVEWTVTVAGTTLTSSASTQNLSLGNGSYAYRVSLANGLGYSVSPANGTATVNGSALIVTITFVGASSTAPSGVPWTYGVLGVVAAALAVGATIWAIRRRPPAGSEPAERDSA